MTVHEQNRENTNEEPIVQQEELAETVEMVEQTTEQTDISAMGDSPEQMNIEEATEQTDISAPDKDAEIAALRQQLDEMKDKYLRLYADFDNAKKRHAREQLELIQTAGKNVIADLLPVLDDFERAMKIIETATEVAAVKEGVELIHNKLKSTLSAKGLKATDDLHKDFNVEHHEALTEIPAPSPELAGKVLDVVQKGYMLNEKLIRFAKVVVGKRTE